MKNGELLELEELAQNRTGLARQALFDKVSDLAFADGDRSPQVQTMLDEIMSGLIRHVEKEVRATLAQRLSTVTDAPPKLLRFLAEDEVEIARPILQRSPCLVERDLLAIIAAGQTGHRQAIASREKVPEPVTRALVDCDELPVMETLLRNPGADISRASLRKLTDRSRESENLSRLLIARPGLPPELAHRMFWWVSAALRAQILERFDVDATALDRVLNEIAEEGPVPGRVAQMRGLTVGQVIQMMRSNDWAGATRGLAALLGVTKEIVDRILADPGGEPLAVACRAIDASRQDFTTLLLLADYRRFGKARPIGHTTQISSIYDLVPKDRAKMTTRMWDLLDARKAA